ncbi:hypothetical protein ON010_g16390 [Phytophthora cinnamomi]|nr:hypothetical protein ON010_g16390 [Phytophthora cinnamomi]
MTPLRQDYYIEEGELLAYCARLEFLLGVLDGRLLGAEHVRADVEVHEEPEERLHVHEVHERHLGRHAGALARVREVALHVHGHELDELDAREVLLPPDVARVRAHEVVRVHDGVHEAVEHDGGVRVAVLGGAERHVVDEEHGQVVVHVQDGELLPLLAEDDEDRVAQVQHLGQVEQVEHVAHDGRVRLEGVARGGRVAVAVGLDGGLHAHVGAGDDLHGVVDELDGARLDGGDAHLHQSLQPQQAKTHRAEDDEKQVADADGVDAGEVGERVVGHGVDLPAALGVHPVEQLGLGGVGPVVVALQQLGRHGGRRAVSDSLRVKLEAPSFAVVRATYPQTPLLGTSESALAGKVDEFRRRVMMSCAISGPERALSSAS